MMKKIIGIFILTMLVTTVLPVYGKQSNNFTIIESESQPECFTEWWPMFLHDISHNGFSTSNGPLTNDIYWSYQTDGDVYSPAVIDDKIYFTGCGGLTCLNSITGAYIWKYPIDACVGSSPAVVSGKIYFGGDNKVYCLNSDTGAFIWEYATGDFISSSPAVSNGKVYIGSDDDKLYCLDALTGSKIWDYPTGDSIRFSSPAIANGKVYIGSDKLYCLNADTGSEIWNYPTGDDVVSSPAIANGKVYVGSNDNKIYCINADTGSEIWNYPTGDDVDSSPALTANNRVYFGSEDKKVYCFDASAGGNPKWTYQANAGIFSSPAIVDEKVYIGSREGDGKLYCFGIDNEPPNKPTINGPNKGKAGTEYSFTLVATDPDNNNIYYCIDWDDGSGEVCFGPFPSGEEKTISHTWTDDGTYVIKSKARDIYLSESAEATFEISIPRARFTNIYILKLLYDRFPLLNLILKNF